LTTEIVSVGETVVVVTVVVSGVEGSEDVFSSNKVEVFTSSVSEEAKISSSVVFLVPSSEESAPVVTCIWGAAELRPSNI